MSTRHVVVTVIGAVSPLAPSLADHYARYRDGASGIVARIADPPDDLAPHWAPAYDETLAQTIGNRMLRKLLQPTAVMAVVAAREALRDSALEEDPAAREAMSLYVASVSFDVPQSHFVPALEASLDERGDFDVTRFATRGLAGIDPLLIVKSLPNAGLCAIAIEHGVLGPNVNISSGSAGGAQALAMAARAVARGETEVAMAAAYDSLLQPEHVVAEKLRGAVAPPGEGAVAWVLESEEHARRRGAPAYAAIAASAESFPSLRVAAAQALAASGRTPRHLFGDFTGEDDAAEAALARELLGEQVAVEGAAAAIGFTGAASGMFSATHAALAIDDGRADDALVWRSDRGKRNVALVLVRP